MSIIEKETDKRHQKYQRVVPASGLPAKRFNHPTLMQKKNLEDETARLQQRSPKPLNNLSISMRSQNRKAIVEIPLDMQDQVIVHQEFADPNRSRKVRQSSAIRIKGSRLKDQANREEIQIDSPRLQAH